VDLAFPKKSHLWDEMATEDPSSKIFQIYSYCSKNCRSIERWPSYFHRRYLEFISYMELFPNKRPDRVLELGCGIGYQSAMLAQVAGTVIATDLPDEDLQSHAPGMLQAQLLHRQLDVKNVELVGCSAENLPFDDNSFDMVYSSHVLEHIPDQIKALNEIYRVLKPGGIHFCVVPTRAEKVYALANFYIYLFQRSVFHLFKKISGSGNKSIGEIEKDAASASSVSILKDFPFPPPHGHYKNYQEELKKWTPSQWEDMLLSVKGFETVRVCTTQFNPLLSLLGGIWPVAGTNIHALTRKLELSMGSLKLFRVVGLNAVIVLKSNKSSL